MSGDAVGSLRDEILERIKQMHDIQRWKLIACAAVVAYFIDKATNPSESFDSGKLLGFLIPSGICFLCDLQWVHNVMMVCKIGKFISTESGDKVLSKYEAFLVNIRGPRHINFEVIAHVSVSLVACLIPPIIASAWTKDETVRALLLLGSITGAIGVIILWIAQTRALAALNSSFPKTGREQAVEPDAPEA